jgi:hypothetical protein
MGGSGGGASTVTENALPDYAQPYVEDFLARSSAMSLEAYAPYTGTTYALRNANEEDGITAIAARATAHHAIITKGETLLQDELDGDKFNVNPKLAEWFKQRVDEALQDFEEDVLPQLSRQCVMAGRYGGGAHNILQAQAADRLTKRIAQLAEDSWGKDTFDEKERQVVALGTADHYGTEDIRDAEMLRQTGLYEREYYQGLYDDAFRKWKEEEIAEVKRLEILGNAIRACVGAQVVTTTPYYRPKTFAQIAGIAMAGVGLYATFYGKLKSKETPIGEGGFNPFKTGTGGKSSSADNPWGAYLTADKTLPGQAGGSQETGGQDILQKGDTNPDLIPETNFEDYNFSEFGEG